MTAMAAVRAQQKLSTGFIAIVFAISSFIAALAPLILQQVASAAGTAVRPANMNGWSESKSGSALGAFSAEQARTGSGSYKFTKPNAAGQAQIENKNFGGTKLQDITNLSYSTYIASRGPGVAAPSLKIDALIEGKSTTLVFEPTYVANNTTTGVWQDWSPLTEGKWWSSQPISLFPNRDTFKPWADVVASYPDVTVRATASTYKGIYLNIGQNSAGNPWANFVGYVDNFTFNGTTYDFEPDANPIVTGENFNTHSGSDYKGINVGFNIADFGTVSAVTVDLYKDATKLATNTHNSNLLNLINSGTSQLSTPFIIQNSDYTETYWNLGAHNLSFDTKPTKAVVTITGDNGTRSTEISPLTEPNNWVYGSLVPLAAPTLLSPTNGSSINGASLTNSWTAVSGATKYQYQSFNNATATNLRWDETTTSTSKNATNVANNTTFWWRVRALNDFGTQSEWSPLWKVTVDNEVPTTPTNGLPHNTFKNTAGGWSYTWNASTDNSGSVTYEYQASTNSAQSGGVLTTNLWNNLVDGDASQRNLTTPEIPSVGTTDGKWYWQVRAIDAAGNKSDWSQIRNVTVDTVKPVINNVTPGPSSSVKGTTTFKVDWSDTNKSYSYIELNKDGTWKTDGTKDSNPNADELTVDTTSYEDGIYGLKVSVVDKAGNSTGQNFTFTIDNTKPGLTFATPNDNELKKGSFPVTINATDDLNLKRLAVNVYNESNTGTLLKACGSTSGSTPLNVASSQLVCTLSTSDLPDGIYTLRASATDLADNVTVVTRTVRIDNSAPVITPMIDDVAVPIENFLSGSHRISMSVEEDNPRAYNIRVYNQDGSVAQINGVNVGADDRTPPIANPLSFQLDTTKLTDGARYKVVFTAVDLLDQRSEKSVWFTVDNTNPVVSINPVTGVYGGNSSNVTINFSVEDRMGSWSLTGPNGLNRTGSTAGTFSQIVSVNGLDSGTYPVALTATDISGNSSSASIQIVVDNHAKINATANDVLSNTATISANLGEPGTMSLVILDEDGDEVSVNETPTINTTTGTIQLSFNTRQLLNGDYIAVFTGTDALGNVAEPKEVEFEIMNNPLLAPVQVLGSGTVTPLAVTTPTQPSGLVATRFNTTNPQTLGITTENAVADDNEKPEGKVKDAATTAATEKEVITQASSANSWWWVLMVIALLVAAYYGYRNWKLNQANK